MALARERSRLVPLKAMLTGNPTPLSNAAIEIPVITIDVIRAVSTMHVIVLNRFIFLVTRSRASISSKINASISDNLFKRYACGFCGNIGFKSRFYLLLFI